MFPQDDEMVSDPGMDPMAAKKRALMELLQYAQGGMAGELKDKYAPAPAAGLGGSDVLDGVEKPSILSAQGAEEAEIDPSLLIKDMDQEAIRRLLGELGEDDGLGGLGGL